LYWLGDLESRVPRISTERLRKAGTLSVRDWLDIGRAQLALFSAQLLVWTRPQGRLISSAAEPTPPATDEKTIATARRLGLAVDRAASYGAFRPRCLVRSVALQRVLESRGIHGSRIRIGVRMQRGRFDAHAWVEYGSLVLGDRAEHTNAFAELTDIHIVPPS
jgi:hypothetical protein